MDGAGAAADGASDAEAFDAFYERTRDRLATQVAALTGDPAEALDHVQEAFIRAWGRWSRVGRLEDPEGWVRRVAHNLAVSRWRRARRTVLGDRPDSAAPGWDEEQGAVLDALARLARPEREAIVPRSPRRSARPSSWSRLASASASLDHPFLFLVRDTTTGAIMFAAQIQDPTAS